MMQIETVKGDDSTLKQIQKLWRANSSTLGFLPIGAFSEYAWRKQILGVFEEERNCVGYLLYRTAGERAYIVHLCVHRTKRGKGIARKLTEQLFNTTKYLKGVSLWCRRDFPSTKIWPGLGFVAVTDKPGKNLEGKELTLWSYDHPHPTLFSEKHQTNADSKLSIAIDASVFFDLLEEKKATSKESRSLLADWLAPSIEFHLTDEIFNEINRRNNTQERRKSISIANKYNILRPDLSKWKKFFNFLRELFPLKITEQDSSDIRHLAKTLASGIQVFVTRDGPLLKKGDLLYEKLGMSVVRPSDIILNLNDLRMETIYQPARFDRTNFQERLVKAGEVEGLTQVFQFTPLKERSSAFKDYLGTLLADPAHCQTLLISESEGKPIALISFKKDKKNTLIIPLLRIRKGSLTGTLARNLISRAIHLSAFEKRQIVRFSDPYLGEEIQAALKEDGFCLNDSQWMKITLPVVGTISGLSTLLNSLPFESPLEQEYRLKVFENCQIVNGKNQEKASVKIEQLLWPTKITETNIPNYIIAIEPRWAKELFDAELSKQDLFSAPPELGLNREAVYYRAKYPSRNIPAPSRILWYVSKDSKYQGTMHIRACSYIDEVAVGKPKELFKRFRRLGVYDWSHVYKLSKNDINREIMAIKFSYTETFSSPVPWVNFQQILEDENCPSRIQSPHKITPNAFFKIYRLGTNR